METQEFVLFSTVVEPKTFRNAYTSGYRNNLTPFHTKTATSQLNCIAANNKRACFMYKCLTSLSDFKQNGIFSTDLHNSPNIKIHGKPPCCSRVALRIFQLMDT
jgi:hypothetical protein